ncbi:MAG: putative lipid II flippase FtsW [Candidatus Doudnabacteria bacterium]|nr:putative lipid II flippase FtsW [Candidatus Doudnabacteria bacterium]
MKQKRFWRPADRAFIISVLILIGFGLVAVSSASSVLSYERYGNNNYYFLRQLAFAAVGLGLIFYLSRVDYHVFRRFSAPIFAVGIFLLVLLVVPGVGFRVGGAARWFNTGWFLIQPSEFVKLAMIFFLATWFERKKGAEDNFWFGILPPLAASALVLGLVVLEPDIGTAAVLAMILLGMLFAAGARLRFLGGLLAAGIAGLWIVIKAAPYRAARIITFFNPSYDPQGISYHINQALLGIGAGGLFGYGLGFSRQKHNYLPEPIGDSIFAVMAEELGFTRIIFLVLLFLLVGFLGIKIARNAPDRFGELTAIGITIWITLQALFNIGAITGVLPLTGIALPFVSYGGSSLLALSIGAGILLNISRQRVK